MKKIKGSLVFFAAILFCLSNSALAETVILKSGEKLRGKILKRTDKYIKMEGPSGPTIYFLNSIDSVDGESPLKPEVVKQPEVVKEPEVIKEPEPVKEPEVVKQPEVVKEPEVIKEPEPVKEPEVAKQPEAVKAPEVVKEPEIKRELAVSQQMALSQPSFNTAKISYQILESAQDYVRKIDKTVYLDLVNHKYRDEESEIFVPGKTGVKKEELNIFNGEKYYNIDLAKGVVRIGDQAQNEKFCLWMDNSRVEASKLAGEEDILGRNCKIYNFGNEKVWLWNGVALKQESEKDGQTRKIYALSIEEDFPLPEDLFTLPESIQAQLEKPKTPLPVKNAGVPVQKTEEVAAKAPVLPEVKPQEQLQERRREEESVRQRVEEVVNAEGGVKAMNFAKLKEGKSGAKVEVVKMDLENLRTALDLYKLDNGSFPSTRQGLDALLYIPAVPPLTMNWQGPYFGKKTEDLWGRPYQYFSPGRRQKDYDLYSLGPDGSNNTADDIWE